MRVQCELPESTVVRVKYVVGKTPGSSTRSVTKGPFSTFNDKIKISRHGYDINSPTMVKLCCAYTGSFIRDPDSAENANSQCEHPSHFNL